MEVVFYKNNHKFVINEQTIHDSEIKFNLLAGRRISLRSSDEDNIKETFNPNELRQIIQYNGSIDKTKSLLEHLNTRGYVEIDGHDSELSRENFLIRLLSYLRHLGSGGSKSDKIGESPPLDPLKEDFNSVLYALKANNATSQEIKSALADAINKKLNTQLTAQSILFEKDKITIHSSEDLDFPQYSNVITLVERDIDKGFDIKLTKSHWDLFQEFIKPPNLS